MIQDEDNPMDSSDNYGQDFGHLKWPAIIFAILVFGIIVLIDIYFPDL